MIMEWGGLLLGALFVIPVFMHDVLDVSDYVDAAIDVLESQALQMVEAGLASRTLL